MTNLHPSADDSCSYVLIMWRTTLSPLTCFIQLPWTSRLGLMAVVAGGMRKTLKILPTLNGAN
jgi:hypothetical protein